MSADEEYKSYIFLTPDLVSRDDFTNKKRYYFYRCDHTTDPEQISSVNPGKILEGVISKSQYTITTEHGTNSRNGNSKDIAENLLAISIDQ